MPKLFTIILHPQLHHLKAYAINVDFPLKNVNTQSQKHLYHYVMYNKKFKMLPFFTDNYFKWLKKITLKK